MHDDINEYECSEWNFVTFIKGSLDKHVKRVHHKIKNYKCDQCDYSIVRQRDRCGHLAGIKSTSKQYNKEVHTLIRRSVSDHCEYAAT